MADSAASSPAVGAAAAIGLVVGPVGSSAGLDGLGLDGAELDGGLLGDGLLGDGLLGDGLLGGGGTVNPKLTLVLLPTSTNSATWRPPSISAGTVSWKGRRPRSSADSVAIVSSSTAMSTSAMAPGPSSKRSSSLGPRSVVRPKRSK